MQHKIRVEIKGELIVLLKPSTVALNLYSELCFGTDYFLEHCVKALSVNIQKYFVIASKTANEF